MSQEPEPPPAEASGRSGQTAAEPAPPAETEPASGSAATRASEPGSANEATPEPGSAATETTPALDPTGEPTPEPRGDTAAEPGSATEKPASSTGRAIPAQRGATTAETVTTPQPEPTPPDQATPDHTTAGQVTADQATPDQAAADPAEGQAATAAAPGPAPVRPRRRWWGLAFGIVSGVLAVAVVAGLGLLALSMLRPKPPAVGDCLTDAPSFDDMTVVDCASATAYWRVAGNGGTWTWADFHATAPDEVCADFPTTLQALWFSDQTNVTDRTEGEVVCLEPLRSDQP